MRELRGRQLRASIPSSSWQTRIGRKILRLQSQTQEELYPSLQVYMRMSRETRWRTEGGDLVLVKMTVKGRGDSLRWPHNAVRAIISRTSTGQSIAAVRVNPPLMLTITVILALPARAQQQPLTQDQVQGLVRSGLGDDSGAKLIGQRGIDFAPTEDFLHNIAAALPPLFCYNSWPCFDSLSCGSGRWFASCGRVGASSSRISRYANNLPCWASASEAKNRPARQALLGRPPSVLVRKETIADRGYTRDCSPVAPGRFPPVLAADL